MRFKNKSYIMMLTVSVLFLLACLPQYCTAGRLPDNPNIFDMSIDEDDELLMNGDKMEAELFEQFKKDEEKKIHKIKEEMEEKKRKEEEDAEEEERRKAEEERKEREHKREQRRLQEEKEEQEEHERRQKELKELERKRKQKQREEEEAIMKEKREHNKKWQEKHQGRKMSKDKQDKWQQEQEEEIAKAKREFEQENFKDETDGKVRQEAENAELRALEPHVETHTKEQKEAIKEREENKDEHKDEVMDRLNPDAVIYQGEEEEVAKNNEKVEEEKHEDDDDEDCEDCKKEREEKEAAELRAKLAVENQEIIALEPHVETHNKVDKKMEEMMKDKPFVAGDIEGAVHGGGHVHEDEDHKEAGIKDMDKVLETDRNAEEKGEIGAEDPEDLMNGGRGHAHGSKDAKDSPGLAMPDDVMGTKGDYAHDDSRAAKKKKTKEGDKKAPGVDMDDLEKAIHGEEIAAMHDHKKDGKAGPGKKITKADIEKLGLSEEMFKGVDLTKLLAKDQRQYERFQKGEDEDYDDDDDDDDNKNSFWGQMSRIRRDYLEGLARRIRNIGVPDMEKAEWDKNDLDDREMPTADKTGELQKGETRLEHEMEGWASTGAKGRTGNAHHRFAPKVGEVPS